MNTKYIIVDNAVRVTESNSFSVCEKLPANTYELHVDDNGFFLKKIDDMCVTPERVYGETLDHVNRIISTFSKRKAVNTGVMLSGIKGSGKTLMTRIISQTAAERLSMPTIIINTPFKTNSIAQFLRSITVPCVVVFDEFDKNFGENMNKGDKLVKDGSSNIPVQNGLLSILDGVYNSNKLFIFSLNEINKVNDYLINRPGRIYYHFKFTGLDRNTIRNYCEDNLNNKEYINDIVTIGALIKDFTFDILGSIVKESNYYNESPFKFIDIFNVTVGLQGYYNVELVERSSGKVIVKVPKYIDTSYNKVVEIHFSVPEYMRFNSKALATFASGKRFSDDEAFWKGSLIEKMFPEAKYGTCYSPDCSSEEIGGKLSYDWEDIYAYISNGRSSIWDAISRIDEDGLIVTKPLLDGVFEVHIRKDEYRSSSASEYNLGRANAALQGGKMNNEGNGFYAKNEGLIGRREQPFAMECEAIECEEGESEG